MCVKALTWQSHAQGLDTQNSLLSPLPKGRDKTCMDLGWRGCHVGAGLLSGEAGTPY